jgi:hypothetical protein
VHARLVSDTRRPHAEPVLEVPADTRVLTVLQSRPERCEIVTPACQGLRQARLVFSRRMTAAAIAAVVVTLLAACGSSPADPVASARELDGAPAWVHQPTGRDCGQAEVSRRGELPPAAKRCLDRAVSEGQTGTLAFIRKTTEGEPGVSFVLAEGTAVKVASVLADDPYGGEGGWNELSCTTVAALPDCR